MKPRQMGAAVLLAASLMTMAACGDASQQSRVASARTHDAGTTSTASAPSGDQTQAVLDQYIKDMKKVVACYRKNGYADAPDPDQFGQVLIDTRKISDPSVLTKIRTACASLQVPMPAEVRALLEENEASELTEQQRETFQKYADCMQANGAPDFPDPQPNGLPDEREWDQTSAGAQQALSKCASIIGDPTTQGTGTG